MVFYNNLFAATYRFYKKFYETDRSRFRTVLLLWVHVMGTFFVLVAGVKKLFSLDFARFHNTISYLFILAILFLVCPIFLRYYSNNKIEQIILKFEEKKIPEKKLWGYITVVSLVLEYVIVALLLRK